MGTASMVMDAWTCRWETLAHTGSVISWLLHLTFHTYIFSRYPFLEQLLRKVNSMSCAPRLEFWFADCVAVHKCIKKACNVCLYVLMYVEIYIKIGETVTEKTPLFFYLGEDWLISNKKQSKFVNLLDDVEGNRKEANGKSNSGSKRSKNAKNLWSKSKLTN